MTEMIKISLPDGSVRDVAAGTTPADIAAAIGPGLAKAALAALTTLSAQALATVGVRVNAVAPALMLLSDGQSDENFRAMHAFNPLARGVEPDDVLRAIRFLVDSPAITGETLTLDGGQRFWRLPRDVQFLTKAPD